jgi:hypothetical protein
MHDEACPLYEDMINNMKLGHDFLLKEFGVKPRIGWQVDPFGHSNTNARIFAEMGFDAWFFGRIDYQDKLNRKNDTSLEWIWFPNNDTLGKDVNIFTHTLYESYGSPYGMDFKATSLDQVIIDENSDSFNADYKAGLLIEDVEERIKYYKTNDIIILLGSDFDYMNAFANY